LGGILARGVGQIETHPKDFWEKLFTTGIAEPKARKGGGGDGWGGGAGWGRVMATSKPGG
jgi:hypothetical protein